jgi:hypothetical protein
MNKFVKITAFTYPHEAHLAKGLLESSGIKVIIKDEYTVQVNHFHSNAIGGVKLLVEQADVENALSILKEGEYIKPQYEKSKIKLEKCPSKYKEKCPYCESTNVIKKKKNGIMLNSSLCYLDFLLLSVKKDTFALTVIMNGGG